MVTSLDDKKIVAVSDMRRMYGQRLSRKPRPYTANPAQDCANPKGFRLKQRYAKFNTKRRLRVCDAPELARLADLAQRVAYGGNPEHKKNPGDFGLMPPADPRPGKSLCDGIGVFTRAQALALLRQGLARGLVSDRSVGDWPRNIWSVSAQGWPLEAQLENPANGVYHGYPMPDSDPFASVIARRWAMTSTHVRT